MKMELYRLCHNRKLLLILLGIVLLNAWMFVYLHPSNAIEELQYETMVQVEHVESYHAYVDEVITNAKRIMNNPFFTTEEGSFSLQNATNIAKQYDKMQDVELEYGNNTPVTEFMEYSLLRFFSLAMVLLLSFDAAREQKKGVAQITYAAAKGRWVLGLRRCGYIVLMSAVVMALNMIITMLFSLCLHGGAVGFGRSIQSIPMFVDVTYQLSIGGFLIRYYFLSVLAIAVIGIFVWMVMSMVSNMLVSTLIVSGTLLVEFICMQSIAFQSNFRFVKCINLMEFLNIDDYLYKYYDINCFGNAVSLFTVIKIGMLLLLVAFSGLGVLAFVRRMSHARKRKGISFAELLSFLQEIYHLIPAELHKILFCNKGIWIVIITVIVALGLIEERHIVYTEEEQYVNTFYENYSGEITEETYAYVEAQQLYVEETIQDYLEVYEKYMNNEVDKLEYYRAEAALREARITESGLVLIQAELTRASEIKEARDIDIYLLKNMGYNKLLGSDGAVTQQEIMVVCLLSIVLVLSGIYKYEENSQSVYLLRAASKGRRELMQAKEISALILTFSIVAVLYGIHMYYVATQYGLPELLAPVQSVKILHDFPLEINCLTYMIGVYILRMGVYLLIADLLVHLAVLLEQKNLLLIFAGVVIVPILLSIGMISYYNIINLNGILMEQTNVTYDGIKMAVLLVLLIVTRKVAYKKWCG